MPALNHWKPAKRVLRCIKGTVDVGLIYRRRVEPCQANVIEVYADASYVNMPEAKSVSGRIIMMNGASITHSSTT
eukprot:scaffold253759_cov17-Prasinocladus_malaysianus.AAC.2